MNCMLTSLDSCEPDFPCFDEEDKKRIRRDRLRRQDGTPWKTRKQRNARIVVGESNVLREPDSCRNYNDEETITSMEYSYWTYKDDETTTSLEYYYHPKRNGNKNANRSSKRNSKHKRKIEQDVIKVTSFFSPRYVPNTVQENSTNSTCPSTETESYYSKERSECTKQSAETVDSTIAPFSWMQGYYDTVEEEPEMGNVWSGDDDSSVAAVRAQTKTRAISAALSEEDETVYTSAFNYIRKAAGQNFLNPKKDPPSDKSMGTTYSIRAEDAGSALHRNTLMRRQQKVDELARAIQKRKELILRQAGNEP